MMTREEILSIEEYCAEHKISHKKRLEELGIPFWNFYKAKQKYRRADEQDVQPGQFVQLASGRYVQTTMKKSLVALRRLRLYWIKSFDNSLLTFTNSSFFSAERAAPCSAKRR